MKNVKIILISLLLVTTFYSTYAQPEHRKLRKIQKYIDAATNDNLVGVTVYINGPKYGKWIGVSGYSNLEEKTPLKKDDVFGIASIGKTYAAVAVLKLVEEGRLGLDDKIRSYLPQEIIDNVPNAEKVTVRHLLGHTSGFANYNADPILNKLYLDGNLDLDTLSHMDALRRYFYGKESLNEPGEEYHYSSTNYLLLTMVMDNVLSGCHEEYLRNTIIEANNYSNTYYKQTPPKMINHYGDLNKDAITENLTSQTIETTNWYSGDDGVYAPIEEAASFLEDLMKGEILSEEILEEMTTWNDEKDPDYGLGLEADKGFPYKLIMGHSGSGIGMRTDLYYFPHKDLTVGIFCNSGLRSASREYAKTYYKMRNKIILKLFVL